MAGWVTNGYLIVSLNSFDKTSGGRQSIRVSICESESHVPTRSERGNSSLRGRNHVAQVCRQQGERDACANVPQGSGSRAFARSQLGFFVRIFRPVELREMLTNMRSFVVAVATSRAARPIV